MLFHRNDARTEALLLSTVQPGGAVGLVPPGVAVVEKPNAN